MVKKVVLMGPYQLDYTKNFGGAHVHTFDLTEHLKKYDDLDMHVLTISNNIKHDKIVENSNITIHYLASPKLPRFITSLTIDQYKILKKIHDLKADIIHAQGTAPVYGFSASLMSKKFLLTVHGIVQEESKTWAGLIGCIKGLVYRIMEKRALKSAQTLIAVTPYVKKTIEPFCNGDIYVIPVGISDKYFKFKNREITGRLLFVGGVEPRKGLLSLLEAIKILKDEGLKTDLHIVGRIRKKEYFDKLDKYIEMNNLSEYVTFMGFLDDNELKNEYEECSMFVLPSQEESQGLVLVEAMAAGKPIVATNVGGIPYVVDDGKTGFLVGYGEIEKIAKSILKLLENDKLRAEMGENGKEKAMFFTLDEIAKQTYDVYQTLV